MLPWWTTPLRTICATQSLLILQEQEGQKSSYHSQGRGETSAYFTFRHSTAVSRTAYMLRAVMGTAPKMNFWPGGYLLQYMVI